MQNWKAYPIRLLRRVIQIYRIQEHKLERVAYHKDNDYYGRTEPFLTEIAAQLNKEGFRTPRRKAKFTPYTAGSALLVADQMGL